jgi:hypothetical protein
MCDSLHENGGQCCGACDRQEVETPIDAVECQCGNDIIFKDEEIPECKFCKDIICDECGIMNWYDTDISICKTTECKEAAVRNLIDKLKAAAYALSVIESITSEGKSVYLDEAWGKMHTISQDAYRAATK